MSSCPRCPTCTNDFSQGTYNSPDAPSTIVIPLCPHLPRHVLLRARDPHIQNQLSGAIHSILAPQWLMPVANGHSPVIHHTSPTSGDLFSSQSSHLTTNDLPVHLPTAQRPPAPTPYNQPDGDYQSYSRGHSPPMPTAAAQGVSPSSFASSMSSWDSSLQQTACHMADSYPPHSTPRAIVKPYRFRFRPILEITPDGTGGGNSVQHIMDSQLSASASPPFDSQPLTPSAPPAVEIHHDNHTLSPSESLALPRPLRTSTPPTLRQDTLQSLCALQQHPKNALVQRWLQSHSPPGHSPQHDDTDADICPPPGFDPPPFPRNSHSP